MICRIMVKRYSASHGELNLGGRVVDSLFGGDVFKC